MDKTQEDWGFELSPDLAKRLEEKDAELEQKIKEGKFQKPPDSPYECVGCGS